MLAVPDPCGPPRRAVLREGFEGWVVTRYADVRAVLADRRFVRDPAQVARLRAAAGFGAVHRGGFGRGATLLHLDPPEHSRIRRMVAPSFGARPNDEHRPMRAMTDAVRPGASDHCTSYWRQWCRPSSGPGWEPTGPL